MNTHELKSSQVKFLKNLERLLEAKKESYKKRKEFVRTFSFKNIPSMPIDDYVIGSKSNPDNFCYCLEHKLKDLGHIGGATSLKFGVYYGKTNSESNKKYRFANKFGKNHTEAFNKVKLEIIKLLEAGKNENLESIKGNLLSPMVKGKILSLYYPERYLNIFSSDHLDYFLVELDIDSAEILKNDSIYKREELMKFKEEDPVMVNWSLDTFSDFLYMEYPGNPVLKRKSNDQVPKELNEYKMPNFPVHSSPKFVDYSILEIGNFEVKENNSQFDTKINYEIEARRLQKLGDRGEKIVMDLERERLIGAGREDLSEKIVRKSLESDRYGYDILSYEGDGSERYIEVKSTSSKPKYTTFFLTQNELETSKKLKNYHVYLVYEVENKYPKVWIIKNPFTLYEKHIKIEPIKYRVLLCADKN